MENGMSLIDRDEPPPTQLTSIACQAGKASPQIIYRPAHVRYESCDQPGPFSFGFVFGQLRTGGARYGTAPGPGDPGRSAAHSDAGASQSGADSAADYASD